LGWGTQGPPLPSVKGPALQFRFHILFALFGIGPFPPKPGGTFFFSRSKENPFSRFRWVFPPPWSVTSPNTPWPVPSPKRPLPFKGSSFFPPLGSLPRKKVFPSVDEGFPRLEKLFGGCLLPFFFKIFFLEWGTTPFPGQLVSFCVSGVKKGGFYLSSLQFFSTGGR